jgi:hypothetical protein
MRGALRGWHVGPTKVLGQNTEIQRDSSILHAPCNTIRRQYLVSGGTQLSADNWKDWVQKAPVVDGQSRSTVHLSAITDNDAILLNTASVDEATKTKIEAGAHHASRPPARGGEAAILDCVECSNESSLSNEFRQWLAERGLSEPRCCSQCRSERSGGRRVLSKEERITEVFGAVGRPPEEDTESVPAYVRKAEALEKHNKNRSRKKKK